jgi:hypothetical protein
MAPRRRQMQVSTGARMRPWILPLRTLLLLAAA